MISPNYHQQKKINHLLRKVTFLFLLCLLAGFLSGCFGDTIIKDENLIFDGKFKPLLGSGKESINVYIPPVADLRKKTENTVGSKFGLIFLFPLYHPYKLDIPPSEVVRKFMTDKLRSMGIHVVNNENQAQAILKISIKEFSQSGWNFIFIFRDNSKVALEYSLYRKGENQPVWQAVTYSKGSFLEETLPKAVENLEDNSDFKSELIKIASGAPTETKALRASSSIDQTPPSITITSHKITRGVMIVDSLTKTTITGIAEDSSGIKEVTVNGKPALLSDNGSFSSPVNLNIGENMIWVGAVDTYMNIGRISFGISHMPKDIIMPKTTINSGDVGQYFALIIGNNNYKNLSPLNTAKNDAKELGRVLRSKYGFKTKVLLDATREEIMNGLNDMRNNLGENDNLLVYYAGHGEYDKVAQKAYWLPVDAKPDNDSNWIIADSITSNIKRAQARHILIIADSCYSGTLTRKSEISLTSNKKRDQYLKKVLGKTSRTLMASGGNEPVSDEGQSGFSVFAGVLLEVLKTTEMKFFTAEELFYNHIKEAVVGRADQTPEYSAIRNSGHNGGDFIFHLRNN